MAEEVFIQPEVMQAPEVWLASNASHAYNGRRLITPSWDERLPLDECLAKASAPAAWPQLGQQAVSPTTMKHCDLRTAYTPRRYRRVDIHYKEGI